jgi:hypothetical protein
MAYKTTFGEYRVGKSFNPSNDLTVARIKEKAAALIDEIDQITIDPGRIDIGEVARCKAIAMTEIESAAMWAVKAATKPERE